MYSNFKGEKISIKNKALILSIALVLFFMISAVSAVNETSVVNTDSDAVNDSISVGSDEVISDNTEIETNIKSNNTNIVKGNDFSVKLTNSNSVPISNKSVQFTINNISTNQTTDGEGVAKLKVNVSEGNYQIKYSFSATGYKSCQNQSDILVLSSSTAKIKASAYTAYVGFKNTYTVTLTVGSTPLENREIVFKINGKTYSKKTDSKGKASINIDEAGGSYTLSYAYEGEENISPVSGSVKITVKKIMPVKITKYKAKIYRNKKAGYFQVKLKDARGNIIKSKKVTFKLNGKTYTKKTNSKGIAKIKVKLKIGSYKVKVSVSKTSKYSKATKTYKIKVKPAQARNNGMWLFGRDMKKANLDKLQKYGFKQIFLNFKALELYGQSEVEKWIKKAKSHGMKVHLWMQVFYSGGKWKNPVKKGKINYDLINSKVKEAKKYAKIKGIGGIHFDYVRYPGNAFKYQNSIKAVNTFVKKASNAVHKINKKLIVSAAIMPEPSGMKKYYGQDIPTMSKYLDVLVPMVYKGNYHATSKWIKSVTKTFKKQSKKAKIWTGLQSYKSDSKTTPLSAKELMKDADAAALGGAHGVILFRYGLFKYINFNNV